MTDEHNNNNAHEQAKTGNMHIICKVDGNVFGRSALGEEVRGDDARIVKFSHQQLLHEPAVETRGYATHSLRRCTPLLLHSAL